MIAGDRHPSVENKSTLSNGDRRWPEREPEAIGIPCAVLDVISCPHQFVRREEGADGGRHPLLRSVACAAVARSCETVITAVPPGLAAYSESPRQPTAADQDIVPSSLPSADITPRMAACGLLWHPLQRIVPVAELPRWRPIPMELAVGFWMSELANRIPLHELRTRHMDGKEPQAVDYFGPGPSAFVISVCGRIAIFYGHDRFDGGGTIVQPLWQSVACDIIICRTAAQPWLCVTRKAQAARQWKRACCKRCDDQLRAARSGRRHRRMASPPSLAALAETETAINHVRRRHVLVSEAVMAAASMLPAGKGSILGESSPVD
ncbi:uncharacterized protein LOC142589859 isoform X2 [Dermacentor variabilis]|uniref:uncharacterized protein LOC142589859 isoform X2 n=1 Tax=Dermacentor variabilis TaxID=34621 RepID=UPI003F5CA018